MESKSSAGLSEKEVQRKIFLVPEHLIEELIWRAKNAEDFVPATFDKIKENSIASEELLTEIEKEWIINRMIEFGLENSAYRDSPDCHNVKEVEDDLDLNYKACVKFKAFLKKLEAFSAGFKPEGEEKCEGLK